MYGYIYLVHDSLNNRHYIGQHKWTKYELLDEDYTRGSEKAFRDSHGFDLFKIDPNYLGSGKHLQNAIKKYGKNYFYIQDILDIEESKERNRKKHLGKKVSDETRNRMRKSHNPNNMPPNLQGYRGMNNGIIYTKIPPDKIDKYLSDGWKFGRIKKEDK